MAKRTFGIMHALRSLASERLSADPRVRLAVPAVVLAYVLFLALVVGVGAWAVWGTGALVLAAAPWVLVSLRAPLPCRRRPGRHPLRVARRARRRVGDRARRRFLLALTL